jgi:hypothetical protein
VKDSDECPECGAPTGELHELGCDVEQCPYCGGQFISCDCRRRAPMDDRLPWAGLWPGAAECREFGWYAKLVPGQGWVSCAAGEPGATEDLNRLHTQAVWDRPAKRFALRRKRRRPREGR